MKCQMRFCKGTAFVHDTGMSLWICLKCQKEVKIIRQNGVMAAIRHVIKEGVKGEWDR